MIEENVRATNTETILALFFLYTISVVVTVILEKTIVASGISSMTNLATVSDKI